MREAIAADRHAVGLRVLQVAVEHRHVRRRVAARVCFARAFVRCIELRREAGSIQRFIHALYDTLTAELS